LVAEAPACAAVAAWCYGVVGVQTAAPRRLPQHLVRRLALDRQTLIVRLLPAVVAAVVLPVAGLPSSSAF